jgi:hypothetical protein
MNQLDFDFSKDVNERIYTASENKLIDDLFILYKNMKNNIEDELILCKLFFEEYCVELVKRLKSDNYFKGQWDFKENQLGSCFFKFIIRTNYLTDSSISEFILILINQSEADIKPSLWQKNDINNFEFDRKITEWIIENISTGNIEKTVLPFMGYVKIWNQFSIYNKPFNNNKALLIHRIFAEKIWPKDNISYEMFSKFEKLSNDIICNINIKNVYIPFFDKGQKDFYSRNYLNERDKLKQNIEFLFDYELTDESESYSNLIEDLLKNPSDLNSYKKDLIIKKVAKHMHPNVKDVEMFGNLAKSSSEKKFGKWLLSKFYLYNLLNYEE